MLRTTISILIVLALISCSQNKQPSTTQNKDNTTVDSVAIVNDPKSNLNIQLNSFTEIDSSGILMFPLSMEESEREGSSLSYKSMRGGAFWNIIFLNTHTNAYHLLSDKKLLIANYDFKYGSNNIEGPAQTRKYIFYSVTTEDYNNDKLYNFEDPKYLFVSDKEGNNFRQISPSTYDLQSWQFIKTANKVLMTVKKDSDKNNKFDDKDEITSFEVDIDKGTAPLEVFSTDFKNSLKILYDRDWRRLKK
jgi:hypothetical protein